MMIIVDTCVWSLALCRQSAVDSLVVIGFRELLTEFRVQLLGPIRQELLTGIRSVEQFEKLMTYLSAFRDLQSTLT